MAEQPDLSEFERGKEAGRVAARLREHTDHLAAINGAIEDSAQALNALTSEVRALREEATLREERVVTAADTLAAETERRRSELAVTADTSDRIFTRRNAIAVAALSTLGLLIVIFHPFG